MTKLTNNNKSYFDQRIANISRALVNTSNTKIAQQESRMASNTLILTPRGNSLIWC